MTPENSEAPRENRYGDFVPDTPSGAGLGVDVSGAARTKVSSPELASLAAKYIDFDARDGMADAVIAGDGAHLRQITKDVRALAASVLAQAEGTLRK